MDDLLKSWSGPSQPPTSEELVQRHAIEQLAKIYALGLDMREYELARSAFADEGIGVGKAGPEPIDDYLQATYKIAASFTQTLHTISNQYVRLEGNEATMWSYGVVHHKVEKDSGRDEIIAGVRYLDRCRKYAEGWLIVERSVKPVWVDIAPPR